MRTIARRLWVTVAGVVVAAVASGVLALQVPSALERGPRSEDLTRLERRVTDFREERSLLESRAEQLRARAETLGRQAERLEGRAEEKAERVRHLRKRVRDLETRVEELGG